MADTRRVAINDCIGSFRLDRAALERASALGAPWAAEQLARLDNYKAYLVKLALEHGWDPADMGCDDALGLYGVARDDPVLLAVVGERPDLGLKIVEIPADVEYTIGESEEGWEWIAEKHRTWR